MNRKQRACIVVGFLLVALSLLFPPTKLYIPAWPGVSGAAYRISYGFLFTLRGTIELSRLFAEWVLIALVVGGLFYVLRRSYRPQPETRPTSVLTGEGNRRRLLWLPVALNVLVVALGIMGITNYLSFRKVRQLEARMRNIKAIYLEPEQAEPLREILDPVQVDTSIKALAWANWYAAVDSDDFVTRFRPLNLPPETKAALYTLKFGAPDCAAYRARQSNLRLRLERIKHELDAVE